MSVCDKKICENCKYLWADYSVNAFECESEEVNEEEIDKYFSEGKEGCPHFVEKVDNNEYYMKLEEEYVNICAEKHEALELIKEYCKEEFEHDCIVTGQKPTDIALAYTETDEGKTVNVDCSLENKALLFYLDGELVKTDSYETMSELINNELVFLEFSELVSRHIDLETAEVR